jgi:hypothetical protein
MLWAKGKNGACLAVFFIVLSSVFCRADQTLTGRWEGSAQIPGRELKLVLDLEQTRDGIWTGSVTIPGLRIKGTPIGDITQSGSDISFSVKNALADKKLGAAKCTARIEADGILAGELVQAGNRAPIRLARVDAPQVDLPPRTTSVAKELEGEWKGQYELFGYPRQVTIKFENRGAAGATAEFVIVGRKVNILPVDLVRQEGDFLTVDSHETGLTFEGNAGKDEIKGSIVQGALEVPVVLRRRK